MSLPTNHTSPSEILHIINKLHNNKAPGHDLITNRIIKNLPKKTIIFLTFIFNSILRLSYIPPSWKHSIIILIHKPGKPKNLPSSFRPISLLPSFSKILEKIILKRIYPIINVQNTIPNTQFGFRNKHSALHQVHRIVDNIASSLERKYFCSAVFLDVAQAFDRVWHKGLLYKTRFLPAPLYLIINSFLSNRTFQVRCDDVLSETHSAKAGVPQGSILAPTLYNIYTSDIPHSHLTSLATFADDTCIISSDPDIITSTENLQSHLNDLQNWFNLWRIKINENKSSHTTFTLRPITSPSVTLNNETIPRVSSVKYLGIHLDQRLTWATHIKTKRKSMKIKLHKLRQLLRSKISLSDKTLVYKQLIRPALTYGIEIWGSTKNSNLNLLQSFQSISLRFMTNAPCFRAFKGELLQNAGPLLHCHRIPCKAATATMMMVNTSPVHTESAAATAEAGVAVLWKVRSQTTKVLMEQTNFDYCSESSSNESATCESVAVASSSTVTHCRVDLSASGGDDDKRGRPAVASVVVTVLALILAVVVVPAGGERDSCDDYRRVIGFVEMSGRVGDPGIDSSDLDLLRI
ncbi:hypothetical protein QTP88_011225 [Uroleucon formosanum]